MTPRISILAVTSILLGASWIALPLQAQLRPGPIAQERRAERQRQRQEEQQRQQQQQQQNSLRPPDGAGRANLPPNWMERLENMSPEQQQRFLNNNQRFRNLPLQRQAQIRRRLQTWNQMTAEQRQALRDRERIWERMSPEEQRLVRQSILPRWQQLAPVRRQAVLRRLRLLRELSVADREVKLKDEQFLNDLSLEERDLLRQLAALNIGPDDPVAM